MKYVSNTSSFKNGTLLTRDKLKNVTEGNSSDECVVFVTDGNNAQSYQNLDDAIAGCDRACTGISYETIFVNL